MSQLKGKLTSKGTLRGHLSVGKIAEDYEKLKNLPLVNGVTLIGDQTSDDLGITEPVNADWEAADGLAEILNKPDVYTQDEVDGIIDGLLPVDEADGSVASFSTDLAKPLVSLKADVNAVQDLHGQSGAYIAGGQLWDETWEVGDYDSSGNKRTYNTRIRCKDQIAVSPSATYCFYMKTASGIAWQFYDTNHDFISQQSRAAGQGGFEFSTPNDCYYMTFGTWDDYGNTYKNDISINSNRTDKSYHPYSNVCPIYGRNQVNVTHCSKNLVDVKPFNQWEQTSAYSLLLNSVPNAVINASFIDKDTTIDLTGISFGFITSNYDKVSTLKTTQYRWAIQNGTLSTNKRNTAAASNDIILTGLIIYPKTEEAYNKVLSRYYIEFEVDATTTFEPYNGTTKVINLGDTIYGGYVTQDNNDLKLVVTHKIKSFSDGNWSYGTWGNRYFFSLNLVDSKNNPSSNLSGSICEIYQEQTPSNIYTHDTVGFCMNNTFIRVQDNNYNSLNSWKEAVKNYKYVYLLAEPIEIPLSDIPEIVTLIGVNNVYADSGDVEVKFKKSIQKYIDDKIAETQALIL